MSARTVYVVGYVNPGSAGGFEWRSARVDAESVRTGWVEQGGLVSEIRAVEVPAEIGHDVTAWLDARPELWEPTEPEPVRVLAVVDSVEIRRVPDDNPDLSYLTHPDRYADCSDADRKLNEGADAGRLAAFNRGDWEFVGVYAVAKVRLYLSTHPNGSCGGFEVSSGGLWGTESDSDPEHFAEIEGEQRADLAEMLHALGLREGGTISDAAALDALGEGVGTGTGSAADHADALYRTLGHTGRGGGVCDVCSGQPDSIPGVLYPTHVDGDNSRSWIERCDACEAFAGDDVAARALLAAGKIRGIGHAPVNDLTGTFPYALGTINPKAGA